MTEQTLKQRMIDNGGRGYYSEAGYLMRYFTYDHLPPHLRDICGQIAGLAIDLYYLAPQGWEFTMGLRKLLESKDCFVRARFDKNQEPEDPSPILQFFAYEHLPPDLREVSSKFYSVAQELCGMVPTGPEFLVGLRKLLESKDCFVRAKLNRLPEPKHKPAPGDGYEVVVKSSKTTPEPETK
jgi:hypothetical protein